MRALWFFIYQSNLRKHWEYVISIRNLNTLKLYHQKYTFLVILKGVIKTALKHWREGAPPAVIIEDTSPLGPESLYLGHTSVARHRAGCFVKLYHLGRCIVLLEIK